MTIELSRAFATPLQAMSTRASRVARYRRTFFLRLASPSIQTCGCSYAARLSAPRASASAPAC